MSEGGKSLVKTLFSTVRRGFIDFVLVHAVYTALVFILFAPLMGALGQLMINISSKPVLADTDILFFLLSPYGMAAMLLFAALLITIMVFEISSMMFIYGALQAGQSAGLIGAFGFTAARAGKVFRFALRFTVRIALIVLPFLAAAGIVGWLSLSDYDINYYLSAQPPIFWAAGSVIALILLTMTWVLIAKLLDWSLALPLVLFHDVPPARSFSASRSLAGRKKKRTAAALMSWAAGVIIISLTVFAVIELLTYFTLPRFYDSLNLLIVAVGVVVLAWSVANFIVTTVFAASFSGILIELLGVFGDPIDPGRFYGAEPAGKPSITAPRLLALAAVGITAAVAVGLSMLNNIQAEDDLVIVAHRGAAGKAPENTMASVHQAIEDEADWVEIDVQESGDGEVVVIHDSDFMKLARTDLKVWEGTLEQIQNIDIGSWFSPEFSDQRVPLLADVLNAARNRANVVIELKYYGHDQHLEERVVDIVERTGMVDQTAIMSLKYEGIQKIRRLRPDWTIGLLSAQALGSMSTIDADFLAVNTAMAKPAFIRTNQQAGKKVLVWTVNDRMAMFTMMSRGVDGIITDEPVLARRVIAERAALSSLERLLIHAAVLLGKKLPRKAYRDNSP